MFLHAYVLLTHGPKPKDDWRSHRAARQQVANIRDAVSGDDTKIRWASDYARSHLFLSDLPVLASHMPKLVEADAHLLMDDLRRLFRHVSLEARVAFAEELLSAGGRIFGLHQGVSLEKLSRPQLLITIQGGIVSSCGFKAAPRRKRSLEDRQDQTFAAGLASQVARRKTADAFAKRILHLKDELIETRGALTLAEIAEAAERQGITSPRGRAVTASTVSRALKRAEAKAEAEARRAARKSKRSARLGTPADPD